MGNIHGASEKEVFELSGPSHLTGTTIDWSNPSHCRSVAACLVRAVSVLERDRLKHRHGDYKLATPWYRTFHFYLYHQFIDPNDSSIFGAIFQLASPPPTSFNTAFQHKNSFAPRLVIAFRGTMLKRKTLRQDLKLDASVIKNTLHKKQRAKIAIEEVQRIISAFGNSKVWIAGHSLGASISLLAGKIMAQDGIFLDAYLFNLPHPLPPTVSIMNEKVKSVVKAVLAVVKSNNQESGSGGGFALLSAWLPSIFVHPSDYICKRYVGYFEDRKQMEDSIKMQHWMQEVLHLIPSAILNVNCTLVKDAHDLDQWWRDDLDMWTNKYN